MQLHLKFLFHGLNRVKLLHTKLHLNFQEIILPFRTIGFKTKVHKIPPYC